MKRIVLLSAIIFLLALAKAEAQQDPQFSQYMFNTLYYNPGFAGVEGITKLTAIHRSQWLGYQPTNSRDGGAPTTQVITFSAPIFKLNSGFGAQIVNDQQGPQNSLDAQASYAYHLGIKNSKLSFGIRTGIVSQTFDFDLYRPVNPNDDLLAKKGAQSQIRPDLAVGLFWRKEKYYVGLSFNHLINSTFDFGVGQRNALKTHAYFTGGYFYEVNFDLKFHFSTLIKSDFNETSVDIGGLAYFKDTMWGGLAFRSSESATLLLGYTLLKDKSLKLGYSLDYVIQDQSAKAATSHELMLSYELPVSGRNSKKVVRTPRYRK